MDLEIRHLRLVRAIAVEGSVTRAGHRLHLTQSALSHQLRDIEERLGTPLFQRLGKKMVLTPAGEKILRVGEQVLKQLHDVEATVRQMTARGEAMLRLAIECHTCYHWLPGLLKVYHRKFPGVATEIDVETLQRPLEALLEGKLDLALMSSPIRHRSLVVQPLFEDEFVAVMHPDHPLAGRSFLRPQDFREETLIIFAPRETSTVFRRVLDPAGVEPHRLLQVQITEAITEMVRAGLGVSVLTRWAVTPQLKRGTLRAVRVTAQGLTRQWKAVWLKSTAIPAHLVAFVNLLRKHPIPGSRPLSRTRTSSEATRALASTRPG